LPYKASENQTVTTAFTDPKAKDRKPEEFVDPSLYNELEKSGFFQSLGR